MSTQVWINGKLVDEESASISVRDVGLLHAIGAFTTMRANNGKVILLQQHLKRLRESCEALYIPLEYPDQSLENFIAEVLQVNNLTDARLRITVTRGVATNDPVHGMRIEPSVFITASNFEPYPETYYQKGMMVVVEDQQKLNPYDLQAGHKTLNYFSRLNALRDANRAGAGEAIWFNVHNYLQSGCISNVFVVKNGLLMTPPTNDELRVEEIKLLTPYTRSNVLPGTTRGVVLTKALDLNIPVKIGGVTINDLVEADEVFITNCAMGVMPVCRIERKPIADEKPGAITTRIQAEWNKIVNG